MRLLLIHGRGQGGKKADELKVIWLDTLREGFRSAGLPFPSAMSVDFPFYGDVLDELVARSALPLPKDVTPKGDGEATPYEVFVQSALKEMQVNAGISDTEVEAAAGPVPATEKGIANWRLTQALARLIDRRVGGVASYTIERYLRDVYLYVSNRNAAREVNAIVTAMLTDEPTVVVGHSLGSVVGYRVLLEQGAKLRLRRYVTVGSPLGIRAISGRLGVLKYPQADLEWYNAYDEGDIVALNPLKDPWFATTPPIVNYNRIRNATENRHGIVGYLNDATVARCVAEALGS